MGGSRDFEAGDTEYFINSSAVITGTAISMFCWFNAEITHNGMCVNVADKDNDNNYATLYCVLTSNNASFNTRSTAGDNALATSSNTFTPGTWSRMCGVRSALNARTINLDGTITSNATANTGAGTFDRTCIGVLGRLSLVNYYDGLLCWVSFWDTNLSEAQQNELMLGIPPVMIATNNCKGFYQQMEDSGNAIDHQGNNTLTETGGTIASDVNSPPYIFWPQGGL